MSGSSGYVEAGSKIISLYQALIEVEVNEAGSVLSIGMLLAFEVITQITKPLIVPDGNQEFKHLLTA